jgi:hypothetical protein
VPAGKYSFYLHSDDQVDLAAARAVDNISQPLRGDFLRTVAAAGSVMYRLDSRLPVILADLFDGQLRAGQLTGVIAVLSGNYALTRGLDDPVPGAPATGFVEASSDRRRFTVTFDEAGPLHLLESCPSRLRGQLLRTLIISGIALHTLDPRWPRLLASLPSSPGNLEALVQLLQPGPEDAGASELLAPGTPTLPTASQSDESVRKNMKKLF